MFTYDFKIYLDEIFNPKPSKIFDKTEESKKTKRNSLKSERQSVHSHHFQTAFKKKKNSLALDLPYLEITDIFVTLPLGLL